MTREEILELVAINVVIHQADGFQQGYGSAITDMIDNMIDYAKGSDDVITGDFMYALVDMGENLAKRKEVARKNLEDANKMGYKDTHIWRKKDNYASVCIYTKGDLAESEEQE